MSLLFLIGGNLWYQAPTGSSDPGYQPKLPTPRVRLYAGKLTGSSIKLGSVRTTVDGRTNVDVPLMTMGHTYTDPADHSVTMVLPSRPGPGRLMIFMLAWTGNVTIDSWVDESPTQIGFKQVAGMTVGIYARYVSSIFGLATTAGHTVFFTGDTEVSYWFGCYEGTKTSSFTDVNTNNTGTSTTPSTGTSAATAQADELVLSAFGMPVGTRGIAPVYSTSGYLTDYSDGASSHYALFGHFMTNITGTQASAALMPESGTWVACQATIKADSAATKFDAIGEFDIITGKATRQPLALGTMDFQIPGTDPMALHIKPDSIFEVYMAAGSSGWTFEWYTVVSIDKDESGPVPVYQVKGFDLRFLIWDRAMTIGTLDNVRGTVANYAVENWVRKYIDATCITVNAGQPYTTGDVVAGLALEASSGNRGTVYTASSPAQAGSKLGDTIAALYGLDALGWRIVLLNAGTSTATLEVQTYQGTDRRFGSTNEMVFAEQWDTASSVAVVKDAVNALTAATVLGKPLDSAPSSRPSFYVKDLTAIQTWGLKYGVIDASTETNLDASIAQTYLKQYLPKTYVDITPRNVPKFVLKTNYDLFDRVSALDRDGNRYDGYIMEMHVVVGQGVPEVMLSDLDRQGITDEYSMSYSNPYVAPPGSFGISVSDDPTTTMYLTKDQVAAMNGSPPETRDMSLIKGYTGTSSNLNAVAGVTAGTGANNKAVVLDGSGYVTGVGLTQPGINGVQITSADGGKIDTAVSRVEPVTAGTVAASKAVVVDGSKKIDTITVTSLLAGAGSNGNVADGATRNPQQSALVDLVAGSETLFDTQVKINDVLSRLRSAGLIAP